jgi:DNA polymerase bacteriophage-type
MSHSVAIIDFETRSTVDLTKAGADVYFEHPSTEILCLCYSFDQNPEVHVWRPGQPIDYALNNHIAKNGIVVAHNASFELLGWKHKLIPLGWAELRPEQVECTLARAAALALPQALFMLCIALRLPIQKDMEGHRIMLQLCKPRQKDPLVWWDDPVKLDRLIEYCKQDVRAEREIWRRLHPLTKAERKLWLLDYRINRRGVQLDLDSVALASALTLCASQNANLELQELTSWSVASINQTAALMEWLAASDVDIENLKKRTVADRLKGDFSLDAAKRVLELRHMTSKASTAKLRAMQKAASADGRARGLLRFHAASTGRWAGARVQPHNMPRCTFLSPGAIPGVIKQFPLGADAVELYGGPVMEAVASCLRAMIIAKPGHDLIGGDYSNIEGRVCAWLAGEKWKLQAFRDYDAGTGPDLYKLTYARTFGLKHEKVTDKERQRGKVMELSLGYGGGLGAFSSMALNYGLTVIPGDKDDLDKGIISEETVRELVKAWRDAHPAIVQMWAELQQNAKLAIKNPGKAYSCLNAKITYRKSGPYLWCILPNGRTLTYVRPRLERATGENAWKGIQIVYEGIDSFTKKWSTQYAYGGMLCENITQAVARDCLADGLFNVEEAGYPVVLHVHDDIVAEVPEGFGSPEEFAGLMVKIGYWAQGLPLTVKAWRNKRYGLK